MREGNIVQSSTSEAPNPPITTIADPFLLACRCFSAITALAATLCGLVNAVSAARSFKNGADVFDGILRCYAVVIACFVAIAETEWEWILKFSRILEFWIGRGMLQIFVAVMTKALSNGLARKDAEIIMHQVASYMLLGCGVVYIISVFTNIFASLNLFSSLLNHDGMGEGPPLYRHFKAGSHA